MLSNEVQKATAAAHAEIVQLKETIHSLRDEMDRLTVKFEGKIQEFERSHRDEVSQLQETASTLREKLQAQDEK